MRKARFFKLLALLIISLPSMAWPGMPMPRLHIDGRYLKDSHGNTVNLHGFAQTYSPWFNEQGKYWTNYDVNGCLNYNKAKIDSIVDVAGWKVNFLRLHMDPHWSNQPGCNAPNGEASINCFRDTRFTKYLDEVFIPMAEYAVSKGLYVIMRPPGVCPEQIAVGDAYNQYLTTVWKIMAKHPKLQNHPNIMFELANEPINILGPQGDYGASTQGHFDNLKTFFQTVVDTIRAQGCNNILWVPGLGYQSLYSGYAVNPIEGENIGYAVHIYPGWFDEGEGYSTFKASWDRNVKPVADFAPVVITEMDWAPEKYDASWGKGVTGVAGGNGFGANFKKIVDESGNVSWLIFTEPHRMSKFVDTPPAQGVPYTFLTDPEACPWPVYHWYQEYAQVNYPRPEFQQLSHSDNGNGTYTNPVIHAEFPDPDVIKVGDVYYMVSTTMHFFPGATLLKSYDLVNWEFCSNPLQMIEASDAYNLVNGQNRYARGQWATSIRYNNGKFYLLFTTLDEGGYLLTATDPEGSWDIKKLSQGYYDPGLLFDDNGKIYVVHGIGTLTMTELNQDFEKVGEQQVFRGELQEGLEGSHLYKINGYYYIYATYGGLSPLQVALRSTNIYGPYEEKVVLANDDNIHQGALIQTQSGEWWTMLFYDKMPYGRMPNLQPITWENNWPMIGAKENGVYKSVKTYQKPNVGANHAITALTTNDNFRDYKLGLQWGWNHNADHSKWSLLDRPGFLRLKTASVVNELTDARNTLTQRIFGYQSETTPSYATIKLHVNNMAEGDVAGLTAFTLPDTYIGVKKEGGVKKLFVKTDNSEKTGATVTNDSVYLRVVTQFKFNESNKGRFYYSFDNVTYTPLAPEFELKYSYDFFVAPRFGIFNYATQSLGGYADIDWFTTEETFAEDTFYDSSFVGYSQEALTPVALNTDANNLTMLMGTNKTVRMLATFGDGHTEDVTTRVQVENTNPNVIKFINGQLIALKEGVADITATYEGALGNPVTTQFQVTSKMFPLTNELVNPKIWGNGSFDETTKKLTVTQYGFGGWEYSNGVDLSNYRYLMVKLKQRPASNVDVSFRIFDQSSYWSTCAMFDWASESSSDGKTLRVRLQSMDRPVSNDSEERVDLDPSHIYRVGFWVGANTSLYIDDVYLDGIIDDNTAIDEVHQDSYDPNEIVDVYSIMGLKVRAKIARKNATIGLPAGVYIVGRQKVVVN